MSDGAGWRDVSGSAVGGAVDGRDDLRVLMGLEIAVDDGFRGRGRMAVGDDEDLDDS